MADNQPRDEHQKALKQAVSQVKQLRSRVMSDPAKADDLVDALNESTALRLVAHRWAEAFPEAQEAVQAADRLVASRGPIGPYTPMVDAARYFTALVHVARLQAGMGMAQAAGQTIQAAMGWKSQLTQPDLNAHLVPRTACWALLVQAAAALADGDLARANACADAALRHAREAHFADDQLLVWVLLDVLALQADCRWAANLSQDAVAADREAFELWQQTTRADLQQLPRMTKLHLDRACAPLFALQRDLADRLEISGLGEPAASLRGDMADLLHRLATRRSDQGRVELALARADQARALQNAGQLDQAVLVAEDALTALQKLLKSEQPVGQHLVTQAMVAPVLSAVELAQGRVEAAQRTIEGVFSRMQAHKAVEVPDAVRAVALHARAAAAQAVGQEELASTALAEFDQLVAGLREASPAPVDDLNLALARARQVVVRGSQQPPHWDNLADADALWPVGTTLASAAAEQAPAPQQPVERVVEPPVVATPEPVVPVVEPVAEPVVPATPPAEEVAPVVEPVAAPAPIADPLDELRTAAQNARGKDQLVRALEELTAALEHRAGTDASLRHETIRAYEQLADAQGWWGGRGTSKHAKQLAKTWGL